MTFRAITAYYLLRCNNRRITQSGGFETTLFKRLIKSNFKASIVQDSSAVLNDRGLIKIESRFELADFINHSQERTRRFVFGDETLLL